MKECQRCGRCCEIDGVYATPKDIKRWLTQRRYDVLQYLYGNPWRPPYKSGKSKPPTLAETIKNSVGDRSLESVAKHVFEQIAETYDNNTDLWFDPITGEELTTCPFLRRSSDEDKYKCLIHETKPEVCYGYYCSGLKEQDRPESGLTR